MGCRLVERGPIYVDSTRTAVRLARKLSNCEGGKPKRSDQTIRIQCSDGRTLELRVRDVITPEPYVVIDYVLICEG